MELEKMNTSKLSYEKELAFFIIIYAAYLFLPVFTKAIGGIGNVGILTLFFMLLFCIRGKLVPSILNNCLPLIFCFLLDMCFNYLFEFRELINIVVSYLNIAAVFFMIYLISHMKQSTKATILKWTFRFNVITTVITLYYLYNNPEYSRLLMNASENDIVLWSGAGSFSFIYCNVLVTVALFSLMLKGQIQNKKKYFLMLLLNLWLIFKASFTLALLVCFILFLLLLYFSLNIKLIAKVFLMIGILIAGIVIYVKLVTILNFTVNLFPQGSVRMRVIELSQAIADKRIDENTDLFYRLRAYLRSWQAFLKYPLGGLLCSGLSDSKVYTIQGGHSYLLDNLAYYGVLSLPFYFLWRKIYLFYQSSEMKKYYNIAWFGFLLIAFLNPIGVNIMLFYLGILLPIALGTITDKLEGA